MKRTGDWGRKKPLRANAPMKKRLRRAAMNSTLRDLVLAIAGGLCDLCGLPLPERWECHHRRLRSQGGRDEVENLLALHDACHSRAHQNRTWARHHGYIVHRGDDPATRPVWRHDRSWQLPTTNGWVASAPPATESEAA